MQITITDKEVEEAIRNWLSEKLKISGTNNEIEIIETFDTKKPYEINIKDVNIIVKGKRKMSKNAKDVKEILIVTKDTKDGTFQKGDIIKIYEDGLVICVQAGGFLKKEEFEDYIENVENVEMEVYKEVSQN